MKILHEEIENKKSKKTGAILKWINAETELKVSNFLCNLNFVFQNCLGIREEKNNKYKRLSVNALGFSCYSFIKFFNIPKYDNYLLHSNLDEQLSTSFNIREKRKLKIKAVHS